MNRLCNLQQRTHRRLGIVLLILIFFYLWSCVGTSEVATQKDSMPNRLRGEANITFLGHSGWAVKTRNHLLIFDCITGNRYLNLQNLSEANVIVFVSHGHKDHYNAAIHQWKNKVKKIRYVSGYKYPDVADTLFMEERKEIQVDDVKITSIPSTDAGVGFLVEVDDLLIFHAGDHAFWGGSFANFKWEIDYLAKKASDIDLMFMPIATGNGEMRSSIYDGVVYAIETLHPNAMFPMHGGIHLLQTFKDKYEKDKKVKGETKIFSPKKNGEVFSYREGQIF